VTAVRFIESGVDRADLDDFEAIVRFHWPRVFRFALASLRDRDAAQSVAQDCFMRAHRARHEFRGESSIQTWVMQIAVNMVRDAARNRRFQFWRRLQARSIGAEAVSDWMPDRGLSPEATAMLKQQVEIAWIAAAGLSRKQSTVFLLRFMEDMDLLEIASVTGMTEGAVKVHLFRAVRSIRKRARKLI
jgi:RNA polymerase sigma-70 factor (ECF subfamily)